jgi:hypothetical protein
VKPFRIIYLFCHSIWIARRADRLPKKLYSVVKTVTTSKVKRIVSPNPRTTPPNVQLNPG